MILRAPPMTVRLSIGEPQYPQEGQHRREFALGAQKAVGEALQAFLPEALLPQSGSVGSRESALDGEEGDAAQAVQA
jgi:1-acyl-sn-glycerol-3-phosphate acyltransferase